MRFVQANEISEPKLVVAPPKIVLWIFGFIWLLFVVLMIFLPMASSIKAAIIVVLALFLYGMIKNYKQGNYLATMQVNHAGLYFQTDEQNQYYFIPWKYIGALEKTTFPLNDRGLRIEIIGEGSEALKMTNKVSNVVEEGAHTYIYTIPQLRDRDKLLNDIAKFKKSA
jgi:hypothetical protein